MEGINGREASNVAERIAWCGIINHGASEWLVGVKGTWEWWQCKTARDSEQWKMERKRMWMRQAGGYAPRMRLHRFRDCDLVCWFVDMWEKHIGRWACLCYEIHEQRHMTAGKVVNTQNRRCCANERRQRQIKHNGNMEKRRQDACARPRKWRDTHRAAQWSIWAYNFTHMEQWATVCRTTRINCSAVTHKWRAHANRERQMSWGSTHSSHMSVWRARCKQTAKDIHRPLQEGW